MVEVTNLKAFIPTWSMLLFTYSTRSFSTNPQPRHTRLRRTYEGHATWQFPKKYLDASQTYFGLSMYTINT